MKKFVKCSVFQNKSYSLIKESYRNGSFYFDQAILKEK